MNAPHCTRRVWLAQATAFASACVLDHPLKLDPEHRPVDLGDGQPIGRPEDVGLDPAAVEAAYARFFSEHEFIHARSFLVLRRGVLVAEGYARDLADRERLQHVKSVTKSVTSVLVGQAIARGLLPGVDARLGDLLPAAANRGAPASDTRLHDLLTMRSGIDWDNGRDTGALMVDRPRDTVVFTLDRHFEASPGTLARYKDADPHLLGAALAERSGTSLESLARHWLFHPLGIHHLRFEHGRDGIDYGAYGLWLRPRDMARFGELCRLGGTWHDQSLVPAAWLETATRPQVALDDDPYGYLWWVRSPLASGAFSANGHGGQYIHVLPEHELVCVHTALPYTPTHEHGLVVEEVESLIAMLIDGLRD